MAGLVTLMLHTLKIRQVDEANDLARVSALLEHRAYGVILIDEQLAGKAGNELISELRKSKDHLNRLSPIIMMASAPDAHLISAARDAGITEFLRKPFSPNHIQSRLDSIHAAPRPFVDTEVYAGPDRRRREVSVKVQRRGAGQSDE